MKKRFSIMAALLVTGLMLIVSCKNASQISYEDISKNNNLNKNGLADVTIKLNENSSRAIYPEEWDEPKKAALFYKLTGNAPSSVTVGANLTTGVTFTYEQLKNGTAKVELQPLAWNNLKLTAYQGKKDGGASKVIIDETKPALEATVTGTPVDFTTGGKEVTFDLKPAAGSGGVGGVDIAVSFYNEAPAEAAYASIDIVQVGSSTSVLKDTQPVIFEKSANFNVSGYNTITLNQSYDPLDAIAKPGIAAGDYTLKVTFFDSDPGATSTPSPSAKIMCQYITNIRIDAGNVSKANINLPRGIFNSKPAAPTNIKATTYFAPVGGTELNVNEGTKTYAQEIDSDPLAAGNKYNVEFTWTDNSFNETGFILHLESTTSNSIDVEFDGVSAAEITKPVGTGSTWAIASLSSGPNGTMGADCNSITLSLPVGTFIDKASVRATNTFGDSTEDALSLSATKLGMFIVAYDLEFSGANASVKLGNANPTTLKYFVQAFNYGATDAFVAKSAVTSSKASLVDWQIHDNSKDVVVKNLSDLADTPGTVDKDMSNQNVTLTGVWSTPATIKVTYPSYTTYKALKAAGAMDPSNKVVPDVSNLVTFTIPTVATEEAKITEVKFELKGVDSKTIGTIYTIDNSKDTYGVTTSTMAAATGGASFEWDINDYLTKNPTASKGTYSLFISYKYAAAIPGSSGLTEYEPTPKNVDGTFYIEVK